MCVTSNPYHVKPATFVSYGIIETKLKILIQEKPQVKC